jgi:dihydroorotase/N-acyl-D-amino-acid deacylase
MGLKDRGILKVGNKADIVIFDQNEIGEVGTFLEPHAYPKGIDYVIVNGKPAFDKGTFNNNTDGLVLRKSKLK